MKKAVLTKIEIFEGDQRSYFYDHKTSWSNQDGRIKPDDKPIKIIEGEIECFKFMWCNNWKRLTDEQKELIIIVYGRENMKGAYLKGTIKDPNSLLAGSSAYFYKRGFNVTCSRCGGSGNYSYCQMYGSKCFKCAGSKKAVKLPTKKQLERMKKFFPNGLIEEKEFNKEWYEREYKGKKIPK